MVQLQVLVASAECWYQVVSLVLRCSKLHHEYIVK